MKKVFVAGVGLIFLLGCSHFSHHKGGEGEGHSCSMHDHKKGEKCSMCAKHKGHMESKGMMCSMGMKQTAARAEIRPLGKNKVAGQVELASDVNGVKFDIKLKGLKANQSHGFHIHEFGDCSAGDGSSAGGHYNPSEKSHGGPADEMRHAGDLGNVTADAKGEVSTSVVVSGLMLREVLGRSLVIHAKADGLKSQPAGNAGDRIGCGVIGIGKQ